MSAAYVDTSAIVAIGLRDDGWTQIADRLGEFTQLSSSNLLEAEMRTAYARVGRNFTIDLVEGIEWVFPDRSLGPEFEMVLNAGYLRGADLWHVATALYVTDEPADISFVTLDHRQETVAASLGFQT